MLSRPARTRITQAFPQRLQSALLGGLKAGSVVTIRDHDCDAGIGDAAGIDAIRDGDEV